MKGCLGYEKSLIVMFVSANFLWKYKEFKIFQASIFSKLGIKARNPALFLQQKQKWQPSKWKKNVKKQIEHQVYTWFFYRQHLEMWNKFVTVAEWNAIQNLQMKKNE